VSSDTISFSLLLICCRSTFTRTKRSISCSKVTPTVMPPAREDLGISTGSTLISVVREGQSHQVMTLLKAALKVSSKTCLLSYGQWNHFGFMAHFRAILVQFNSLPIISELCWPSRRLLTRFSSFSSCLCDTNPSSKNMMKTSQT